jgi:hypothetical protein
MTGFRFHLCHVLPHPCCGAGVWICVHIPAGNFNFYSPDKNISKISKMEKSIIFALFLLILSITTTFLKNFNYDMQFSNQKWTCKILQTTAGTFSNRAPLSFAKNSPPPQQFFDWFCQHKYKPKKLYSHIILFSPTISTNLKYLPKSMPHSPSNRAKRYRMSQQVNQVNSQTDLPDSLNSNLINLPTIATSATNLIPTKVRVNQANSHANLPGASNSTNPTNLPTTTTNSINSKQSAPTRNQINQVIPKNCSTKYV